MFTQEQAGTVMGGTLYGTGGDKIGRIGQVFVDDSTGQPEWVTVHTGLFGSNESFVPIANAELNGNDLTVPFSKDQIKGAPNVDPAGGHLSEQEEEELYRYYGMSGSNVGGNAGTFDSGTVSGERAYADTDAAGTGVGTAAYREGDLGETTNEDTTIGETTTGRDVSGPTTDNAMTRSEERLRAGTETVESGRARLRKWVETEQQDVTVPVTKERARLVTEPITEENRDEAYSGPAISEEEHEVTLREERPVVEKETVPVERVRLDTDTETEQQTVSGEVRKERIDLDQDSGVAASDRDRT